MTFRLSGSPDETFEALNSRGILVRNVSHYPGLSGCLRVSMGSPEQNDRFLEAMRAIVRSQLIVSRENLPALPLGEGQG